MKSNRLACPLEASQRKGFSYFNRRRTGGLVDPVVQTSVWTAPPSRPVQEQLLSGRLRWLQAAGQGGALRGRRLHHHRPPDHRHHLHRSLHRRESWRWVSCVGLMLNFRLYILDIGRKWSRGRLDPVSALGDRKKSELREVRENTPLSLKSPGWWFTYF